MEHLPTSPPYRSSAVKAQLLRDSGEPLISQRIHFSADMINFLRGIVRPAMRESLYAAHLSDRQEVLSWTELWWGAGVVPRPGVRSVYAGALHVDARFLIVAHYLPKDDPQPTLENYARTRRLVRVGELLDIDVLDSIVLGRKSYRSVLGHRQEHSGRPRW